MSWTLKSDKTGRAYTFAEDVTPEEALKYLDEVLEKDMQWGQVPAAIGASTAGEFARLGAGIMHAGSKLTGAFGENVVSRGLKTQAERASESADWLYREKTEGAVPSLLQEGVIAGGASLLTQVPTVVAPALGAALAVKRGANWLPALQRGLGQGLKGMAGAETVKEFGEQVEGGQSTLAAAAHGSIAGLAEYIPERWAFTPILKLMKADAPGIRGAIMNFLGRELVGEQLTTAAQWLNRKMSINPALSLADLWHMAQVTGIATIVGGPAQGVMSRAAFQMAIGETARREMAALEKAGKQPPEPSPVEPPVPEVPTTPEEIVQQMKTRLFRDEELVLGETPGSGLTTIRQLPFEQRLELFRIAHENLNKLDFQATAEDRIRARGVVMRLRTELNEELMLNPDYRSGVLVSDIEMGLRVPDVTAALELDVDRHARATPAEIFARGKDAGIEDPALMAQQLMNAYGIGWVGPGVSRPVTEQDMRGSLFSKELTDVALADPIIAASSDTNLLGQDVRTAITGAAPGTVVFAGLSTDLSAAQLMTDIITRLVQTYMPSKRIVISGRSTGSTLGGASTFEIGTDTYMLGAQSQDIPTTGALMFDYSKVPGLSQKNAAALDTLLHEFTHLLHMEHWYKTSVEEKAAVAKEFHADLAAAAVAPWQTGVGMLYSAKTAAEFIKTGIAAKYDPTLTLTQALSSGLVSGRPDYWFNFNEWMAHKGVKYFQTRLGVRKESAGFFRRLVETLRKYYGDLMGHFKAGPAFSQWLDNIAYWESGAKDVIQAEDVQRYKQELIQQGFEPAYADLLASVAYDPHGEARRIAQTRYSHLVQSDFAKQHRTKELLAELGQAIDKDVSIRDVLTRTILGRDLLEQPLFKNSETWNEAQFFDAFMQQAFPKAFLHIETQGIHRFAITIHDQYLDMVYNEKTQTLEIYDQGLAQKDLRPTLQLAVIQYAMRELAKTGQIQIYLRDDTNPQVADILAGEKVIKDGPYVVPVPYYVQQPVIPPLAQQVGEVAYIATLYHGGLYDPTGNVPIKTTGRGALGTGAYFTPDKPRAVEYANESGGRVTEATIHLRNPLIIDMQSLRDGDPTVMALIQLGMDRNKASNMVEKAYDQHGYVGKQIQSRAIAQGYDGLVQKIGGKVTEVVIWSQHPIQNKQVAMPPLSSQDISVDAEQRMPAALHNLGEKYNIPFMKSTANSLARFNAFFSKALGAYQLIKLNQNVPGMLQEKEALRNRMAYRHKWLKKANATVEEWAFNIDKGQAAKVARLLFDEAESGKWLGLPEANPKVPGAYTFRLDPVEAKKRGMSEAAQELYSNVRNDLMQFADEWHKVGMWEIARSELDETAHVALAEAMRKDVPIRDFKNVMNVLIQRTQDPAALQRIEKRLKDLNDQFENWKASPYMPYTRFGRWGVLVRDAKKKTKYFAGYDSKQQRDKALTEIQGKFPQDAVSATYLEDVPYMLAGLPPAMAEAMKTRLNLSNDQLDTFSEILSQISHANSFAHRAERKAGVEGYTKDALRAYSDYFRRGSAYLARVKSEPEMNDAMRTLKKYINDLTANAKPGEVVDVTNLGRLHEWFTKHHNYLNTVGNEYGEVKSFMALFHFGFNAATAMVNMTQVPLVTMPYLTDIYKTTDVIKAMARAYKDVVNMYAKNSKLTKDEEAMLSHALGQGFRDESQATVIAQIADGSALARASPVAAWQRALNTTNHYAMWMFSKSELLNRDVTLLATYRLQRQKNPREYSGDFDASAFDMARTATEDTHNEYSRENRPEFMRGAGSTIFQFLHFVQNMAFLQLGGDKSWWRLLLVQSIFTGALGLPFANDIKNYVKAMGRIVFGADWDLEREARLYLNEMGADPDLVLRGLTSNFVGMDVSRRISLGELIPGAEAVGSHRKMQNLMYDAIGDVGGPAVSLFLNGLSFVAEHDKTTWDAWSKVLPTSMRNLGKTAEAFSSGAVRDRSGAVLLEPDIWDMIGMSVGFIPQELGEQYNARSLEMERAAYWTTRRQSILEYYGTTMIERDGDREALSDLMKRVDDFNRNAPDPALLIRGETLRNSLKNRLKANVRKEVGLGSSQQMQFPTQEIRATFRNIQ